jgi:hypothetical protein
VNIFRVFALACFPLCEEVISAFVTYLLAPQLRDNRFGDTTQIRIELELPYPTDTSIGYSGILVRCGE